MSNERGLPGPLEEVSAPELRCLELAWQACAAGTVGVGAVLVGPSGGIVAEGANGLFAPAAAGPLANTLVAHAEMNVLAQIAPRTPLGDHTFYTSLEPCVMCAGALLFARPGRIYVGASDELMQGAISPTNAWVSRHHVEFEFSQNRAVTSLAKLFAVHRLWRRRGVDHPVVRLLIATDPELAARIEVVVEGGVLARAASAGASFAQVCEQLEDFVA